MSGGLEGLGARSAPDRSGVGEQSSGWTPKDIADATVSALREPLEELRLRVSTLESLVRNSLGQAGSQIAPPLSSVTDLRDPLARMWSAAPLTHRLAFLRGLLPSQHPGHAVLGEVARLVELSGSTDELEAWIQRYPSLFAEAAARMVIPQEPPEASDDVGRVAAELVLEAREQMGAILTNLHVTWILPASGSFPGSECEVVGEEAAVGVPTGSIKTIRRPGFRRHGRLELPAQVMLASATPSSLPVVRTDTEAPPVATTGGSSRVNTAAGSPDWLQALSSYLNDGASPEAQRCYRALSRVALCGETATDGEVTEAFGPLLTWLSTGWDHSGSLPVNWLEALSPYRVKLCHWLASELNTELVSAAERDVFDAELMEGVGERRTAHPHERGTVARLQTPGLRRGGRVLLRARVIRYESGGAA